MIRPFPLRPSWGGPRRVARATVLLASVVCMACNDAPVDQQPIPSPPPPPGTPPPPSQVTATITVDTLTRFQVMSGWEAVTQAGQDEAGFAGWQQQLMDLAANDLGLNRLRLEVRSGVENPVDSDAAYRAGTISTSEWRSSRYLVVNDNADPNVINAAGFHFSAIDRAVTNVVLPLRQRVEANGERLYINLNYVSFNPSTTLAHLDPAEYAEFLLATFQHLQSTFGFVPDAVEVILEPDANTPWVGTLIGQAIVAAGNRLALAGFRPEFVAPSTTNMANVVPYLDQMVAVPGVMTYLKEVSYHRYGGVSDANLAAIRARASALGLRTAMLEHIGSGVEDLFKDLTIANVSGWQQYTLAYPTSDDGAQYFTITGGLPVMGSRTRALRQYFHFVRRGAFRVAATSTNAAVRPVGFTNPDGGPVVVLHTERAETLAIRGLRAGRYSISNALPSAAGPTETTVGADGELRFSGVEGVITVAWRP